MEKEYQRVIKGISSISHGYQALAENHLLQLAKPPGSLGQLEVMAARLCGIFQSLRPEISKRCILVVAADNGVVAEGVASAPVEVTKIQTINIALGVTGVGVLAQQAKADIRVTDVGIQGAVQHPLVGQRKIRNGTGNILWEPAMTRAEVELAIFTGMELVSEAIQSGYQLFGTGEMGIGNTSTSSAVLAALLGSKPFEIGQLVGRGAGLSDQGYERKIQVLKKALALHQPKQDDPIGILAAVGGLDLAALTGIFLGAAYWQKPVVIDGFISAVAALCAYRLNPLVKEYMFASHASFEKGYTFAMEELGLIPCLHLDMRLGEGSGCPLLFGLMDSALAIFRDMATFDQATIDNGYLDSIVGLGDKAFGADKEAVHSL